MRNRDPLLPSRCALAAFALFSAMPAPVQGQFGYPTITTTSPLRPAIAGVEYRFILAGTGGYRPYRWFLAEGRLPPGLTLRGATGEIAGMTSALGTYEFVVRLSDAETLSATRALSLSVVERLVVSTSSLPGGRVNSAYSADLEASGGVAPYRWAVVSGSLPPGVTLDSAAGRLSGTPAAGGRFEAVFQVTDESGQNARLAAAIEVQSLSLSIAPDLGSAMAGTPFSRQLAATGGTSPYSWSLVSGALPPGVTLSTAGAIDGTPSQVGQFQFTVRVTDAAGLASEAALALTVTAPPAPGLVWNNLPDSAAPAQQIDVGLALTEGLPLEAGGELRLIFEPRMPGGVDDPAVQFSTGGRSVRFAIPAGATAAAFPEGALRLQTGTVAGTVRLEVTLESAGATLAPNPAASRSIAIALGPPVVTAVQVTRTANGFELVVRGFAPGRRIQRIVYRFTPAAGASLETQQLEANVEAGFSAWFGNQESHRFGSQFALHQQFEVTGSGNPIGSISVTVGSPEGDSNSFAAPFP